MERALPAKMQAGWRADIGSRLRPDQRAPQNNLESTDIQVSGYEKVWRGTAFFEYRRLLPKGKRVNISLADLMVNLRAGMGRRMVRRVDGRPGRQFLYVSKSRLLEYVQRADDRLWRKALQGSQVTFQILVFQFSLPVPAWVRALSSRPKAVQVQVVEDSIRRRSPVGDLAVGERGQWVSGRVAMDFAPIQDGSTVLFCGYAGPLIVAMFVSSENMTGPMASTGVAGSYYRPIKPVNISGPQSPTFGSELEAAVPVICEMPQPVRFLGEVIGRGALPGDGPQREFLVARPLYVETAYQLDKPAHVPVLGNIRWFSAVRGWGLIYPDGGIDAVFFRSSEFTLSDGQAIGADQRVEFRITNGSAGIEATSVRSAAVQTALVSSRSPAPGPGQPQGRAEGGWMIGPYRVLRPLAEGTMGVVYLAQDSAGNPVAIKLIRPEYASDPAFLHRFDAEVRTARKIRAANVARILHAGTAGGQPYLVTEYIAGPTLEAHGPVPNVAEVAAGIAAGLAAIHKAGVVHRDLAPSNVILSPSGPVIIDFGLARSRRDIQGLSQPGQLVGTVHYASPEQINHAGVTQASDIFSWAGVTVFAATGHPPFGGEGTPLLRVTENIRSATPNLGDTSGNLRELLAAALSKDPRQRPTAKRLITALAGQAPRRPAPDQGLARVRQRPYRRLSPRTKAGAAGVVVVACAVLGIRLALSPSPPVSSSSGPSVSSSSGPSVSSLSGSPGASSAHLPGAPSGPATGVTPGPSIALPSGYSVTGVAVNQDAQAVAVLGISGTTNYKLFVRGSAHSPLKNIPISSGSGSSSGNPAFDPRNSDLVAVGDSSGIEIWNWVTGQQQPSVIKDPKGSGVSAIAYTGDGSMIAEADQDSDIYLLNASTGSVQARFTGILSTLSGLAISRSGGVVAAATFNGVYLWKSPEGAPENYSNAVAVAISPDGALMALGENETGPQLRDLTAQGGVKTLNENVMSADAVAFSPDGATLATGGNNGDIYLWNLVTDRAKSISCPVSGWGGLAFSPDGKTLAAFGGKSGTVYLYSVTY